jgi:hypothetical protein
MDMAEAAHAAIAEACAGNPESDPTLEVLGDVRGNWDPGRIAQLLQNLIGNALQHGSDKRDVTVTLKGEPDAIRLMVHNHGSPISEDAIATIFDPLVRSADEQLGQPSTSLGLGLFIVKEVVNAHQGRLKSARMKRTRGLRWYCPESFEAVATGGLVARPSPATDSVFRLLHHQPPQPLPQHPVLRPQLLHLFEQVQRQGDAFPFQFQVAPQLGGALGQVSS